MARETPTTARSTKKTRSMSRSRNGTSADDIFALTTQSSIVGLRAHAELTLGDLAARRARERVEHDEAFRPELLAGAALFEVGAQFVERDRRAAGTHLHERAHPLSERDVGH